MAWLPQRSTPHQLDQSQNPERDALIIALRKEGTTYKAIGEQLGLTRQRVTQLHDRAIAAPAEQATCWCGAPLTRVPGEYQRQGGRPPNPAKYCSPEHAPVDSYTSKGGAPGRTVLRRVHNKCYTCGTAYDEPRSSPSCRNCQSTAQVRRRTARAELAKQQGDLCAICNSPETTKGRSGKIWNLSVDHCHKTGKVRALLCTKCNILIGTANENLEILRAAIEYLQKHAD